MKPLSKTSTILKSLCILTLFATPYSYATFGFIIPTYIATETHKDLLRECIRKIRLYHANKIILINDHSPLDISDIQQEFSDVSIELSMVKGAAEMNPYLYFYSHKCFDTAVILHDSMHLNKPLSGVENIKDIQFIRNFTNHILQWERIKEPRTQYNQINAIITHEDLIIHLLKKVLTDKNVSFLTFCLEKYYQKRSWTGCFGIQTIISHDFLKELQEKTNILDFTSVINNRRERMAMESIFSLACHLLRTSEYLRKSYDGTFSSSKLVTANFTKIALGR